MRVSALLFCLACLICASSRADDPPEILRAREELRRIQALVEAGALPANRLRQAQEAMEDAQDEASLGQTLYGRLAIEDLTEQQANDMVAAARRRVERQQATIEHTRALIDEGALPRTALEPLIEEKDYRATILALTISRSKLLLDLAAMARAEQSFDFDLENSPQRTSGPVERFDGDGIFYPSHLEMIGRAFEEHFERPLPVSARGATAVHRALGFDHRGRVDVALDPDRPEGVWLRRLLEKSRIPYYAFRSFVPGKSTAPHIHIGPPSARLHGGG
jgi:hypothetical protein